MTATVTHPKTGMKLTATVYAEFMPNEKNKAEESAKKIEGGFVMVSKKASNFGCFVVFYPTPKTDYATRF